MFSSRVIPSEARDLTIEAQNTQGTKRDLSACAGLLARVGMRARTILEQSRQNRARISDPKLKTRCHSLARTKMRSMILHRDLVHVQFSNPQRATLSQGSSPILPAKPPSKRRSMRDCRLSSPQKSAGPDGNRSNRSWAGLDQQETARTELLHSLRGAAKIHESA